LPICDWRFSSFEFRSSRFAFRTSFFDLRFVLLDFRVSISEVGELIHLCCANPKANPKNRWTGRDFTDGAPAVFAPALTMRGVCAKQGLIVSKPCHPAEPEVSRDDGRHYQHCGTQTDTSFVRMVPPTPPQFTDL
jgi:hypothetical protein